MEDLGILLLLGLALYFLPTIVGAARNNDTLFMLFLLNLSIGWTLIGWLVALWMALDGSNTQRRR